MKVHRPLFWSQGMLLQPQHFQLLDQDRQGHLAPYHSCADPHFWGTGALRLRKGALSAGTVEIEEGEFFFRDGTFVWFPENACVEARSFEEALPEGGQPLAVYLGVRRWHDAGENVTVLPALQGIQGVSTRFVTTSVPEEVRDLHAGGPDGRVQRLRFVLKILWETELEQAGDYEVLPLVRLERTASGIRPVEEFIAPCLACSASPSLHRLIREIRDQVTARGRQLEEFKSKRGIHSAEFGSRDMAFFLALRSVNRYLPLLFHYTESRPVHPWKVYGLLRQLVGELSAFSERVGVLGERHQEKDPLPEYDHQNLWSCFCAARDLITGMLDEITAGPEYVVDLAYDGIRYGAELKPSIFDGRNRFYLAVRTEEEPITVHQALEGLAKLAAPGQLDTLVSRSLPGVALQYLQIPPQELPRRSHTYYFAIDHRDEKWAAVAKDRGLALYWNGAPQDLEIQLMAVGR